MIDRLPEQPFSSLTRQAQKVLDDYQAHPDSPRAAAERLRSVVESSPALIEQLNQAVSKGTLERVAPRPPGEAHAAGSYRSSDRSIRMSASTLADRSNTVFTLGHELQHALNLPVLLSRRKKLTADLAAQHRQGSVDYTEPIRAWLDVRRWDEGTAQLAGWNALVGYLRGQNPDATLADVARRIHGDSIDFVALRPDGSYVPRDGLSFNRDLTVTPIPSNIDALARNFFDKAPEEWGYGPQGVNGYATRYGAEALGIAVAYHRRAYPDNRPLWLNTRQISPSREQLSIERFEACGVSFGKDDRPATIYDTSVNPPSRHQLHDKDGSRHRLPDREGHQVASTGSPGTSSGGQREDVSAAGIAGADPTWGLDLDPLADEFDVTP